MLARNVTNMSKNHILFQHNGLVYYESIDNDNKLHIFNEVVMNVLLEQFEERIGIVRYHDIVQISTLENHDEVIRNLPHNLKNLTIMSSVCTSVVLEGPVCQSIETISIDKSNIGTFPDISRCANLRVCKINHSRIGAFDIQYDLPNSLMELNLQTNLITNRNFAYDKLLTKLNNRTLRKVNLSDNWLNYDEFPEELRIKCNLIRQKTYVHNRIAFANVGNDNIMNFVQNLNQDLRDQVRRDGLGLGNDVYVMPPPVTDKLLGSQNVHLSSINNSVSKSVSAIHEIIRTNRLTVVPLETKASGSLYHALVKKCFQGKPSKNMTDLEVFQYCFMNRTQNLGVKQRNVRKVLEEDFAKTSTNSITHLTYKETFEAIWTVLCFKFRADEINILDAFERIETEVLDGELMCFTGKYNRLMNSMVGIIDGVRVGFSEGEELQMEFGKLIQRLNSDPKYTFDKAYCDAKEILSFIKTPEVVKTWLDAILDLQPDPVKFKWDQREYYRTWDDDLLDLRDKSHIGYFLEEPNGEGRICYLDDFLFPI